jgi:hypothetical protein
MKTKFEIFWKSFCVTKAREEFILRALSEEKNKNPEKSDIEKARISMSELWSLYDLGGISVGRSLRSVILETVTECMDFGLEEESKYLVSLLIRMYHDVEYINRYNWYDFEVDLESLPLRELKILIMIGTFLEIENIPDILECESGKVRIFVKKCEDTLRSLIQNKYEKDHPFIPS